MGCGPRPAAAVAALLVLAICWSAFPPHAAAQRPGLVEPELEHIRCGTDDLLRRRMSSEPRPVITEFADPTLKEFSGEDRGYDPDDGYRYIRIGVNTEDLKDPSRYCTAAGQMRPDFQGNLVNCTAADVLTPEKRHLLVHKLLPRAVRLHEERLKVLPLLGFMLVPFFDPFGICGQFTIPLHQQISGISGYDFSLYVAAAPAVNDNIGWAVSCADNLCGRPVIGMMSLPPRFILDQEEIVRSIAHEIAHALGFNYQQFSNSGMVEMASVRGKPSAPQLTSANVVAAGRDHFGWSGLTSVELEDEGGAGTAYSHWKRRNLKNELMAGIASIGYYTALTMAAFEDLGFYRVDYSKAEIMPWGYKAGEKLLTEKCVQNGVSQYPDMFCDNFDDTLRCTADRRAIGTCNMAPYTSALPHYYQYFANPTYGGLPDLMDYCPFVVEYRNTKCTNGNSAVLPGSVISSLSRCFDAKQGLSLPEDDDPVHAVCAEVECDPLNGSYEVRFAGQPEFMPCPEGATVAPAEYTDKFVSGHVTCPSFLSLCGAPLLLVSDNDTGRAPNSTNNDVVNGGSSSTSTTTSSQEPMPDWSALTKNAAAPAWIGSGSFPLCWVYSLLAGAVLWALVAP